MIDKPTLKVLRVQKGLTQEQLAEELGVSQQTITSWENGRTKPTMETMKKITDFYGVEPSVIYYAVFNN